MDAKSFWQSKTFWLAAATILTPLYPPVGGFIAAYPEAVMAAVGILTGVARAVTDKPVKLPWQK